MDADLTQFFLDNAGEEPKSGVTMLRVSEIEPRPDQPRKISSLRRLLRWPILLRKTEPSAALYAQERTVSYQIIAGERRWRASKMAGLY